MPKLIKIGAYICVVGLNMISWALRDMSKILWGSYIRIFELTRSLGATLVHGNEVRRALRTPKYLPLIFRNKTLIIFGYGPTFLDIFLFKMLKHRYNLLYDVADIPHIQAQSFGVSTEIDKEEKRVFLQLAEVADTLLFISPTLRSLAEQDITAGKKVLIVPNASNPNFFKSTPLPHEKKKVILCVSGYAPMRGIDMLVDAFCTLRKKRRDTILKLVGHNIPSRFKREGVIIERNKFYSDMPRVYSDSYVCVIPHRKNPYMDSALPIKLFDAMAASRPLVVTNCIEMSKLVETENCGLSTDPDANSLSKAIDYMLSNPISAEELGAKGRQSVEKKHSWNHRAQTIERHLSAEIHL